MPPYRSPKPNVIKTTRGDDSSAVERSGGDRKIANLWFDSRTGNASFCPGKRYFTFISRLGQAVYHVCGGQA